MLGLEERPREEVDALRWERFKQLLEHAYENVPYYRKVMEEQDLKPSDIAKVEELARLPVLTKAKVQRNFPDRITAQNIPSTDWRYVSTRGTANRLISVQDFRKRDMVRATELRSAHLSGDYRVGKVWAEIPPDVCSIVCGDENEPDEGVFRYGWELIRKRKFFDSRSISNLRGLIERKWLYRRITYPPFGADGTNIGSDRIGEYVSKLRKDKPFLLKALPTYAYKLAQYVVDKGLPPIPVTAVKPMGGSVSNVMRDKIAQAFTGAYREDYGSSEFGSIACDCSIGSGLHIFSDCFLIEITNDGVAVEDGQLGKILITDLSNFAMPMIRYEIGDIGYIDSSLCECGRTSPRLWVEGRVEDAIELADGSLLSNDKIMDFFYQRPEIDQFQLIQRAPSEFELLVVPQPDHEPGANGLVAELKELLGHPQAVDLRVVASVAPETSGKFRFVKAYRGSVH